MWLLSNKIKILDSGLLEGFCDYHCHLLPGVDDGVQEIKETLEILNLWEETGVKEVWLTPHIMEDIPNTTTELTQLFETLKTPYTGSIRLHLASENMMDRLFIDRLENGELLPLGNTGKYLLVETSYYNPPMDMERIIDMIKTKGFTPVLAHPERYQYMDMGHYRKWKQTGVLLQLNVPSLVGVYGIVVQKKAKLLLEEGLYDYCGTDTHSLSSAELFLDSLINKKTVDKIKRINENIY